MAGNNQNDDIRSTLINKIYDVILNPEKSNEFMADWEKHISGLAAQFDERKNSSGPSEELIRDDALETHFSRAHAILERMGRNFYIAENELENSKGVWFRFKATGELIEQEDQTQETYGEISQADELAGFLDESSANRWLDLLEKAKRAPSIARFTVLSEQKHGNLIAYVKRHKEGSDPHIIVKKLAIHWTENLNSVLRASFGLTPKEIEIIQAIAMDGSINSLAEKTGKSKLTLRSQLKSVFQKMNVNSQQDLVQATATLAHFCMELEPEEHIDQRSIELGDVIAFSHAPLDKTPVHILGAEEGRPVIFIHGMMDGVAITQEISRELKKNNLKLISPVRPGFGSAHPQGRMKEAPEDFARILLALCQKMKIQDALLLGHMSGSVFAFAAARLLRQHARGIVNISGGVPILSTKQFSTVARRQKGVAYTARFAPSLLPMILRAGVAQIDAMKTNELMNDMYVKDSIDWKLVQNPAIAHLIEDGYRFAVAQGYKAFQTDAYHVTRNWSELVERANLPMLLIHGCHDPVVPIHTVREFAKREMADLQAFRNEGQLIFYSNPKAVCEAIAGFFDRLDQR